MWDLVFAILEILSDAIFFLEPVSYDASFKRAKRKSEEQKKKKEKEDKSKKEKEDKPEDETDN